MSPSRSTGRERPRAPKAARRTANLRERGRAEKVVRQVMAATAAELGRVGYAAFRVEDVAARSGIHKTTIYRRWPPKADLVAATITTMIRRSGGQRAIDTGTVRGDLRASASSVLDLNPAQQGILRIMQVERALPEVRALADRFRDEIHRMRLAMVERGVARGELPKGVDADLIVDLVSAPVQGALLFGESIDARYVERLLDVVLAGAGVCVPDAPRRSARSARGRAAKDAGRPRSRG